MGRGDMHMNVAGQALATKVITEHICASSYQSDQHLDRREERRALAQTASRT